jgi:hypothetical protein
MLTRSTAKGVGLPRTQDIKPGEATAEIVEKFLTENVPGYMNSETPELLNKYNSIITKLTAAKFPSQTKQLLSRALWFATIAYNEKRQKIDEDIDLLEELKERREQETQRLLEIQNRPGTSSEENAEEDDESLGRAADEELAKEGVAARDIIINLLKTSQEDGQKIKLLQETLAAIQATKKEETRYVQTPRRTPNVRFGGLGLRASSMQRPAESGASDGQMNRTHLGVDIKIDEESDAEQERAEQAQRSARCTAEANRALRDAPITVFTGEAKDKPFGNNFQRFLFTFENHANGADENTKMLVLTGKLKGKALELYYNKTEECKRHLDYKEIVELMESVFYSVEADAAKLKKFRELQQREDQHLDEFLILYKIAFRDYIFITTGQPEENFGGGKMLCNFFYKKTRSTLRQALDKKFPYLWEGWNTNPFTLESLYTELKTLESVLPPTAEQKEKDKGKQNTNSKQQETQKKSGNNQKQQQQQQQQAPPANKKSSYGLRCNYCQKMNHIASECRKKAADLRNNQSGDFPPPSKGTNIVPPAANREKSQQGKDKDNKNRGKRNFNPNKRYGDKNKNYKPRGDNNENNQNRNSGYQNNYQSNNQQGQSQGQNYNSYQNRNPQGGERVNAANDRQQPAQAAGPPPHMVEGQTNTYPQSPEQQPQQREGNWATPLSMFNYAQNMAPQNLNRRSDGNFQMGRINLEVDPDTPFHPEHSVSEPVFKCYSIKNNGWSKITRFSLWKCHFEDMDNPPWIRSEDEDLISKCDDVVTWAQRMKHFQEEANWPEDVKKRIERNREVKGLCVDNMQFRFALIILDVYIEDVLFDTGSMYNAISLRALYALAGRFDSFMRAMSEADWNPKTKTVGVVGGGETPILGTVEMEVQTSTGRSIPIVWVIYDDVDFIIILGTPGMRSLGFQCRTKELNNYDLFKSRRKSEEISSHFYKPAMAPFEVKYSGKIGTSLEEEDPPSTSRLVEDDESSNSSLEEVEDLALEDALAVNKAAVKFLADAQRLGPYVMPEERDSILGGKLLETALEDRVEPLIDLDTVVETDFRPENIPAIGDEEIKQAESSALIGAINTRLKAVDFQEASLEPKPPNFFD